MPHGPIPDQDDQAYAYQNWSASSPTPCSELPGGAVPASVPATEESEWTHPAFRGPLETFFTVGDDDDFQANGPATVAAGGLDIYTNPEGVPGWANSLLLASLSRGAVYRMALSANHQLAVGGPAQEFKTTNRYRDLAIRPDGRAIYVVTDSAGRTRDALGQATNQIANPGAILEFLYVDGGAN